MMASTTGNTPGLVVGPDTLEGEALLVARPASSSALAFSTLYSYPLALGSKAGEVVGRYPTAG